MTVQEILELRGKRAALIKENRELLTLVEKEKRDLTAEEKSAYDKRDADIDSMKEKIDREERLMEKEREILEKENRMEKNGQDPGEVNDIAKGYAEAFRAYVRNFELAPEQRSVLQRGYTQFEKRALAAGVAASGGYTVPEDFYNKLIEAQLAWGGMRQAKTEKITTESGATLPVPTENDTGNKGAILGENTQAPSDTDPAFGVVNIEAYMYTSKIVLVSLQLLQDSAFDVDSYLSRKLGIRISRAQNEHFTTGTGTAQPRGVVTAAAEGKVGLAGQTTSVTYNDLVDLQHSIDPAYRINAEWMFNDSTLKALKKLIDGNSKPLWTAGLAVREPDTILGKPYVINQDMADMAISAKSILFGDFSNYMIRDVKSIQLMRLTERYADSLQVGFLAFQRGDGDLINAGTNPIKYYQNSAT